jgi:cytochrome b561
MLPNSVCALRNYHPSSAWCCASLLRVRWRIPRGPNAVPVLVPVREKDPYRVPGTGTHGTWYGITFCLPISGVVCSFYSQVAMIFLFSLCIELVILPLGHHICLIETSAAESIATTCTLIIRARPLRGNGPLPSRCILCRSMRHRFTDRRSIRR